MKQFEEYIAEIEAKIGYKFRDPSLLKQAFTRESYVNEVNGFAPKPYQSSEVLEFFGDSVLSAAIVSFFAAEYAERYEHGIKTRLDEGAFSNIKSHLSDKANLSRRTAELDLGRYLLLGEGDVKLHIANEPSVKEDLFESIVGAIYLDSDMNMQTVISVVTKLLNVSEYLSAVSPTMQSSKNALQEFCQDKKRRLPLPSYKKIAESGPDHKKTYVCACYIGEKEYARAEGKNLRLAESEAAKLAFEILKKETSESV